MLRRDMELHRVTSHALGCPAAFRAMPWMDRKTTTKGWQAYVEGAGDHRAVARRGGGLWMGWDRPERPRNGLTDTWRVVPGDRLATFEPGGLPKSWRISAVRRNAADLSLVVNDPVTGEPVEPDLMALLRDGCFDFDRSRETPEWQGFWRSERGMVAYRDASGFVRRWTPGMMKPTHGKGRCKPRPWAASSP